VSTLQADVVTVEAIGEELATLEAEMATTEAVGAEQATRIAEIANLLYGTPTPSGPIQKVIVTDPSPLSSWVTIVLAVVFLLALGGFFVATWWGWRGGGRGPGQGGIGSGQGGVRAGSGSYTAPQSTRPAILKPKGGPPNPRK
jgi:hypothetical protein